MDETWSVEVWGVRGSSPAIGKDFLEYGGNTSCILVNCGKETVVFDAGSGLLELGKAMQQRGVKKAHIFLSHLHIDHICGLFGFPLFLDAKAEIHVYGKGGEGIGLKKWLTTLLGRPCWPLGPSDFLAHLEIHEIAPGDSFKLVNEKEPKVTVHALAGNHPGGSVLYRVENGEKSVIYGLDCEMNEKMIGELQEFSAGTNLLIWDANFTDEDLVRCRGWGHSSWRQGLDLGRKASVKTVLMTHYCKEYIDTFIKEQQKLAAKASEMEGNPEGFCCFAKEGMVICL